MEPTLSTPPPPPPPPPQGGTGRATMALILGIVGLVCCQPVAPVAWYLGSSEGKRIRAGQAPAAGETQATVGKILGIIGTVLFILAVFWIVFAGGMAVLQGLAAARG